MIYPALQAKGLCVASAVVQNTRVYPADHCGAKRCEQQQQHYVQQQQPAVPVVEPVGGRGGEQEQHRAGRASAAAVTGRAAEAFAAPFQLPSRCGALGYTRFRDAAVTVQALGLPLRGPPIARLHSAGRG